MKLLVAKNRAHQVINVDSINNEACDFLATHIPFRNIVLRTGVGVARKESVSEADVFYKLFEDSSIIDKHQLIIVEGSSGSGKSHFIRWLYTSLLSRGATNSDEVLLIRRSENTLKGTIKQLLKIDAVKNLKNRDLYERLVKANATIDDAKFKEEIYAKFIVEINVSEEDELSSLEKKRLLALLSNDLYKSKMMGANGPIERVFSKISNKGVAKIDIIAEFRQEDFIIDMDLFDTMYSAGADRYAINIAKRLTSDDLEEDLLNRITHFMNSKVEEVIQSCAGIEPGDFQQIFREIRQELYAQGKDLILLIEDITSFTGINQALLNALVTEHTGLHATDHMCKLVSVVGTTEQYYQTFRDNYKDRITTQITIEDGTIGQNKTDLYLFFAKYLNAISVEKDELEEWRVHAGATEEGLPVHVPDMTGWESVQFCGKQLSLYPFTKKAIENLYNCMEAHKTPRYILLEIIKPAIDELLTNKSVFLRYLKTRNKPNIGYFQDQIRGKANKIDAVDVQDYAERAIAFISFWGNGNLRKKGNKIAGIDKEIFEDFGFLQLWDQLIQSVDNEEAVDDPVSVEKIVANSSSTKTNKNYENFISIIDNWYYQKKALGDVRYVREELSKFVFNTINWQQHGVPIQRVEAIKKSGLETSVACIARQGKETGKYLIKLEDDFETYRILSMIGQWTYLGNKSWDFDGAYNAVFILTNWLESRKNEIICAVKDYNEGDVPKYIKAGLSGLICEKILNKQISKLKVEEISIDDILGAPSSNLVQSFVGEKWDAVTALCKTKSGGLTYEPVLDFFTITQGASGSHRFLDYVNMEKALSYVKKRKFDLADEVMERSKYVRENEIIDHYLNVLKKMPSAIEEGECRREEITKSIYDKFGWEISDGISTDDLKELLGEIKEFVKKAEQNGFLTKIKLEEIEKCAKNAALLSKSISNTSTQNKTSIIGRMLVLANNDLSIISDLNDFLIRTAQDVDYLYPKLIAEIDSLTKQGKWVNEDPRFAEHENMKNICIEMVES